MADAGIIDCNCGWHETSWVVRIISEKKVIV